MKVKKGQYFYSYSSMYKCYRIYQADADCTPPYSASGSVVSNELNYTDRREAMKRVCELNGWEYDEYYGAEKRKQQKEHKKSIGDSFKAFCKYFGL